MAARTAARLARSGLSVLLGLAMILAVAATVFAVRLSQGPVPLPFLARIAERWLEPRLGGADLEIGAVLLSLGEGPDRPSGLRLADVAVRDRSGAVVFAAASIAARFHAADALAGDLAPTELVVAGVSARFVREADGAFRARFLDDRRPAPEPGEDAAGTEAIRDFIEALAAGRTPALRKLERIRLGTVALRYDDLLSGRSWQTQAGSIALDRSGNRLHGRLELALAGAGRPDTTLTLDLDHALDSEIVALSARFAGAWPADIADQIPPLGWLRPIEAPVSGEVALSLTLGGTLDYLTARFDAGAGAIRPGAAASPLSLSSARLAFVYDGRAGTFDMERLEFDTEVARIAARGTATAVVEKGAVTGIEGALDLAGMEFSPRDLLAAPVRFETGRLAARLDFDPFRVRIDEIALAEGALRLSGSGEAVLGADGWTGAFRAEGAEIGARDLVSLWPVAAAPGARDWVARAMTEGTISAIEANLGLVASRPELSVAFAFRDAVAFAIPGLPPITGAAGSGELDLAGLVVALDRGVTRPPGRGEIDLAGSVFAITDFSVVPAPARATLLGHGEIGDLLALIDQPPLGLLGRIGVVPDLASGRAEVAAELAFPLRKALKPADVAVSVAAILTGVGVAEPRPGLPVRAERLSLSADGRGLRIQGPVRIGPSAAEIDWVETFRPEPGEPSSRITARLALGPALLAALGADGLAPIVTGAAPARLSAERFPDRPLAFTLAADLGPVAIAPAGPGWTKPGGETGSLRLSGTLGETLALSSVRIEAGDLTLEGSVSLDRKGRLREADFATFRLGRAIDSRLILRPGTSGIVATLRGGALDLTALEGLAGVQTVPAAEGPGRMPVVDLVLDRLVLTPRLVLGPVTGRLAPAEPGAPFATLTGPMNGGAPCTVAVSREAAGLMLALDCADAGQFLSDSRYFRDGQGGVLHVEVRRGDGSEALAGRLTIRGITVREAPVLTRMLTVASVTGVLENLARGGLMFDRVDVPFERRDGRILLGRARATGPSIGLTVEGVYDEGADVLDLRGVFSPAYLLNGLLGEVPLVGDLLTGRRGEGIFGFSYTLRGSAANPRVAVNPLSILAPGVLRSVFETPVSRSLAPGAGDLTRPVLAPARAPAERPDSVDR